MRKTNPDDSATGMKQLGATLPRTGWFPVGQLRKCHGKELVQADEVLELVVATMLGHTAPEGTHGQIGHELRKHELALVHTGPSRDCAKAP